ncbi:MAG: DUF5683 domain-containing protein [Bacteroidales bacterium]|jgi:hypothetical protein|nr:DUF5683 domain-containing protein [Bacteroidales bacterium]
MSIGKGQNPASVDNNIQQDITQIQSPHKAAIYSALIPGLGQIYNKKYWKLPIIYGATGILIYAFDFNNEQYNKYKNAYARMDAGEITIFEGVSDKSRILRAKDDARRNRDLNVISLAAIYLLNVLDATVDAHLFNYEINDDLSLNFQPTIKQSFDYQNSYGLSLSLNF